MASPPVETSWKWRRWVTIGVLLVSQAMVGVIIWRLVDPTALKWIAMGLISFGMLAHTSYLTGATVADWAKVVAAARSGAEPETPKDGDGA